MKDVGVVGLGPMGRALVEQLIAEGYSVNCFDIDAAAVANAAMSGASPATSARQVAEGSEAVFTVLPGPAEVLEAVIDPETGVLPGLKAGAMLIEMTTGSPQLAKTLGAAFSAADRAFVDAPVSGRSPRMTVLVGGEQGVLGDNEELLDAVATTVTYCGRPGAGYATKLLNQQVKYASYLASCEALVLAGELGLDPSAVAGAIEQCSGGAPALPHAAEFFRGDTRAMRAHAPARTIEKDMLLSEAMATEAGVSSPTLSAVADFFREVADTDYRDRPYPESVALLAKLRSTS